jgi:hypothetical protein
MPQDLCKLVTRIRWPASWSPSRRRRWACTSFLVLRGSDLTRLMVTLALPWCCTRSPMRCRNGPARDGQGMAVGPLLGRFDFDLYGRTAYAYSLTTRCSSCSCWRDASSTRRSACR